MKIAILGAGAFGQVLGELAEQNGHAVAYFDPHRLPKNNLKTALKNTGLVFYAAPADAVTELTPQLPLGVHLVSACKGFLSLTNFRNFSEFSALGGAGFATDMQKALNKDDSFSGKKPQKTIKLPKNTKKAGESSPRTVKMLGKNTKIAGKIVKKSKNTEKNAKNVEKTLKINQNPQFLGKNQQKIPKIDKNEQNFSTFSTNSPKNTEKQQFSFQNSPKFTFTTSSYQVAEVLKNPLLDFEFTGDTLGIMLCGALKNIYALGAGLLCGQDSESYFYQALVEMRQILEANGADPATAELSCGEADLRLSCSGKSRNFAFGQKISVLEAEALSDRRIYGKIAPKTLRARQNLAHEATHATIEGITVIKNLGTDSEFVFPPSARLFVTIVNQMQPFVDSLRTAQKSQRGNPRRLPRRPQAHVKNLGVAK